MPNRNAVNVTREQARQRRVAFMFGSRELRQEINNPLQRGLKGDLRPKPLLVILKQGREREMG